MHFWMILYQNKSCTFRNCHSPKKFPSLTDWENHRLQSTYENFLITKLIVFECVNGFGSLFYIAFVDRDQDTLCRHLATIMITKVRPMIGFYPEQSRFQGRINSKLCGWFYFSFFQRDNKPLPSVSGDTFTWNNPACKHFCSKSWGMWKRLSFHTSFSSWRKTIIWGTNSRNNPQKTR